MGTIDEVRKMREQGLEREQIRIRLIKNGLSEEQVQEIFSQTDIKEAVSPIVEEIDQMNMQPSMLTTEQQNQERSEKDPQEIQNKNQAPIEQQYQQEQESPQVEEQPYLPIPAPEPQEYSQQYDPQYQQPYQDYQQYPSALSPDTISEIAEQAIMEKIGPIKDLLEKSIDLKNTLNVKIDHLFERIQRIESIIDKLQISVLQRVGEYVSNISDIKKEIIETQKSFKAMHSKTHLPHQNQPHNRTHPNQQHPQHQQKHG